MCRYSGKQFEICSQGEIEGEGRRPDGRLVESLDYADVKKCPDKRVFSLLMCAPLRCKSCIDSVFFVIGCTVLDPDANFNLIRFLLFSKGNGTCSGNKIASTAPCCAFHSLPIRGSFEAVVRAARVFCK